MKDSKERKSASVRYRLMFVDDDHDIAGDVAMCLNSEDFDIVVVPNGNVALMLLDNVTPDLVVIDDSSMSASSLETVSMIRKLSSVPVIVLSQSPLAREIDDVMSCGADDFIIKPFDKRVLVARIRAKLRRSLMQSAAGVD